MNHNDQIMTEAMRTKAAALGFEIFAVAPVEHLERAEFFREWIERQFHGLMGYMARAPERRGDPRALLPGARSVICVGKNYFTSPESAEDPRTGRISRYAWGDDYHDVLWGKLDELKEELQRCGANAKVCVDTSAVLEKPWAQKAGIGWQGKHTNLITRNMGSWLFLGEVLTDATLSYDDPWEKDHCGSCRRCIDLCPTKAIVAPYVLDSRRCISYLTIEHRGWIDRSLRPLMGNLIFGCDICQDVCPWNKFARRAPEAAFLPRAGNLTPSLIGLLDMSPEEFRRRYKGSPILRAKHRGFLRNVCIALGNSGDPSAVPALNRALRHPEPLVRGHAAWALGRLGAREELGELLEQEPESEVREEIRAALQEK